MLASLKNTKGITDDLSSSSVFDTPCSSVSSASPDKPDIVIVLDDDNAENDIKLDKHSITDIIEKYDNSIANSLIEKLEINTELIVVKPNLPIRICATAKAYSNLQDTHIIMVLNPRLSTPEYFRRHLLNIDYKELRAHYQDAFQNSNQIKQSNYTIGDIIRVRKFGNQYHNVRIVDIDCSIIKICFFERKSKKEIWIHTNSSIIEQSQQISQSTTPSIPSSPQTPTEELNNSYSDLSRLRKRKSQSSNANE
ncbi:unnamed protein product, partial [Rotaria magnacalcarata]